MICSILVPLSDFALGGTERIAIRLANAWGRSGVRVTLFCGADAGTLAGLVDRSVVRVEVAPGGIARGRGSRRRLGRAAADFQRAEPHDACFVPGNYHWPAILPLARAVPRPAIVAQVSAAVEKPQRRALRRALYRRRMRRLLGRADGVVTLSLRAERELRAAAPRLDVRTIPLPALADDEVPPTIAGGSTILAAGRLVPEKGFQVLIEAFARAALPEARLAIVGEGPARPMLEALVARLGLAERVTLPGYAPDIRPWLDAARMFVLPSFYEGYAAVIVEALAAGRPVVASDCTPAAEELLGEPGFGAVVPIADAGALAAALEWMIARQPPDPARLAARVAAFRIGPVAAAYLRLFEEVAG